MNLKKTLVRLSAATAVLGGLYAFSDYVYRVSSVPHTHTDEDDASQDIVITNGRKFVRNHPDRTDVYIDSFDSLKLHASFIPAKEPSEKYVILIHGIWDNHEANGVYAEHYLEKGFNCLLPDLRGFGQSEGKYIGYGLDDRKDILEWINWIIQRNPESVILLHGMSMGAATTLMTTGEFLPENVKGAIADSSYTTLPEEFAGTYRKFKGSVLPIPLAIAIMRLMIRIRSGFDINDVRPIDAVKRSTTPTLFIHGDDDTFIDPHMCSRLYEAANCPKHYCIILGAEHIQGVVLDPFNYWAKVDTFISKYIG